MKTFYRAYQLAQRYGVTPRTIDRMKNDGRLPPPDIFMPFPMWSNDTLEANERAAALRVRRSMTVSEPDAV